MNPWTLSCSLKLHANNRQVCGKKISNRLAVGTETDRRAATPLRLNRFTAATVRPSDELIRRHSAFHVSSDQVLGAEVDRGDDSRGKDEEEQRCIAEQPELNAE